KWSKACLRTIAGKARPPSRPKNRKSCNGISDTSRKFLAEIPSRGVDCHPGQIDRGGRKRPRVPPRRLRSPPALADPGGSPPGKPARRAAFASRAEHGG